MVIGGIQMSNYYCAMMFSVLQTIFLHLSLELFRDYNIIFHTCCLT